MSDQFPKKVAKKAILAFVKGFFSRLGDIVAMVLFPFNVMLGLGAKFLGFVIMVLGLFVDAPDSNDDPDSNIGDI